MVLTTVIVGASVAGVRAAQSLRDRGYSGRLHLVDAEDGLPYDKPALSKDVLTGQGVGEPPPLVTADALTSLDIEFHPGTTARALDLGSGRVELHDGRHLRFTDLVVATGSTPRRLACLDGVEGVYYLRSRDDAHRLRAALAARPAVAVVGGGVIGAEVAAAAAVLGAEVTIVEAAPRLMSRLLPAEVAADVERLHRANGVDVRCGTTVRGHRGGARVEALELSNGTLLPTDVVVVGVGTAPATQWLASSGLTITDGIVCRSTLAANGFPHVYAAGDVARWFHPRYRTLLRVEHWTNAREQAAAVAHNIIAAGDQQSYGGVPYVWSDQHGVRIQHVGRQPAATVRIHRADYDDGSVFVHADDDLVTGASAIGAPRAFLALRRRLAADVHVSATEFAAAGS